MFRKPDPELILHVREKFNRSFIQNLVNITWTDIISLFEDVLIRFEFPMHLILYAFARYRYTENLCVTSNVCRLDY